ncbi:MAG TPA: twin-arginine translocation signal domain-containing protein [Acidimicrobiales bacterium]|nr:twin-arginine translocation signal domain-containing protein [Acidimicrobiales bacterium]
MEEFDPADEVAEHVGFDRRSFVKRVALGAAFAVPAVTSFSMSGVNSAYAQPTDGTNLTNSGK